MTTIKKLSTPQVEFGEYFTAVSANIIHQETKVANSTQTDANNSSVFVKSNGSYNQSDYPDLYNRLGLIGAGVLTPRTSGAAGTIVNVAYGNGIYMYGSSDGTIGTSTDGITWSTSSVATVTGIKSLTYGNGLFVFLGQPIAAYYNTSTDGALWTTVGADSNNRKTVSYGGGYFVYDMTSGGGGFTYYSTNGTSWTQYAPASGTTTAHNGQAYANGKWYKFEYLYVYELNLPSGGQTQASQSLAGYGSYANDLAYGNGIYVMAAGSTIFTSTNARPNWTVQTSGTSSAIYQIVYNNGLFTYFGAGGAVGTSTDGVTWTASISTIGTPSLGFGYYVNGKYFTGSTAGQLYTSTSMSSLEYSPYYNAATQFYVPTLTESSTLTLQATTTLLSSAIYTTYVRAK